jgi:hypothetical protein
MHGANYFRRSERFVFAVAMAALAIATPSYAFVPDTETADAQVAVVTAGEFIKVEDLNFGVMLSGPTAGTVVVTPAGTRTKTGGVTLFGNSHHPAEFAGRKPGNNNRPVRISVASNTIQLTGPGAPMTVRLFNGNTNPGQTFTNTPRNFQVQGQANGTFELRVGATLDVNANQAPGVYTGNWALTLDYQ